LAKLIILVPAVAVILAAPPGQVVTGLGVGATLMPGWMDSRLSVNVIPLMPLSSGAVMVIVRRLVSPVTMEAGENALLTSTGSLVAFTTVRSLLVVMAEELPTQSGPLQAVIPLTGMVFSYVVPLPGVELVTLKVMVQEPGVDPLLAGILPPVTAPRVIELAVKVISPPLHCGEAGLPEIVKFAGNVSVKSTAVKSVALLLYKVMVTVFVPPRAMV
jgi:hypothetical protein